MGPWPDTGLLPGAAAVAGAARGPGARRSRLPSAALGATLAASVAGRDAAATPDFLPGGPAPRRPACSTLDPA